MKHNLNINFLVTNEGCKLIVPISNSNTLEKIKCPFCTRIGWMRNTLGFYNAYECNNCFKCFIINELK